MFQQYKIALQDFYKTQIKSHSLPSDLEHPNRTKLKQAFLRLYRTKNNRTDTEIIRSFFDPDGKYENQMDSIERIDLDKLRPLITFLTTGSQLQADAPVHALAWLLGFTPYNEWRATFGNNDVSVDAVSDDEGPDDIKIKKTSSEKSFNTSALLGIALVICISLTLAWRYIRGGNINNPTANQKCMYWDGNQYIPIECNRYTNDATVIPLDMHTMKNFKRVKWPDLLTKKDIGKVFYAKRHGRHEFFTDSGSYPLDPQKRLRPMSSYIWSHHLNFYRFILQSLFWVVGAILIVAIPFVALKRGNPGAHSQ